MYNHLIAFITQILLVVTLMNKIATSTLSTLKNSFAMIPNDFTPLLVSKITKLSHDAKLFEISFPDNEHIMVSFVKATNLYFSTLLDRF